VDDENRGTENSIASTNKMTLLVVKSESFFPTFDSSGSFISASGLVLNSVIMLDVPLLLFLLLFSGYT